MGWLYFPKPHNVKRWFEETLAFEGEHVSQRVLASSVSLTEAYAAVERVDRRTGKREVGAAVFLLRHVPGASDGYTFGYKDMFEDGRTNCPARILDLLTPTDDPRRNRWRAECRENLERRANLRGIQPGDVVVLDSHLTYAGEGAHRIFVYEGKVRTRKGMTEAFRPLTRHNRVGGLVKVKNWRNQALRVYKAADRQIALRRVLAEDGRRAAWTRALAAGGMDALPAAAYEVWLDREAADLVMSGSRYQLEASLQDAGLASEQAKAITDECLHLLGEDGRAAPLRDLLAAYWTPEAAARSTAGDSWRFGQTVKWFAATPGLDAPAAPGCKPGDLDDELTWLTGELVRQCAAQGVAAGEPEPIGAWRYTDDNRAALVPVETPEGRSLFLLVAVHAGRDSISITGFSDRDTSEINRISQIDLRPMVTRPDGARPNGDIADLVDSIADLRGLLADIDAAAATWEAEDADDEPALAPSP